MGVFFAIGSVGLLAIRLTLIHFTLTLPPIAGLESRDSPWNPYPIRGLVVNITSHGAIGNNSTICTQAIQAAINEVAAKGGGYVRVPAGVFLTGRVSLRSGVYLLLDDNGILQGSPDKTLYSTDWDHWHIVQGINISNTGIIGPEGTSIARGGEIRGPMWQMIASWNNYTGSWVQVNWEGWGGCMGECRPKNLAFIDSQNVTVTGVSLRDSSDWTQLFRRCRNVLEDSVEVTGDLVWGNNDGLDVESGENLTFSNSIYSTGDDCLAFRSGNCNTMRTPWPKGPDGKIQPLRGVRVRNVKLQSTSSAIKVEALFQTDHGDLSDIEVTNATIRGSNRGIGVWQRSGNGTLCNLTFRNIDIETNFVVPPQFWGSGEPIVVTSIPDTKASVAYGLKGIHNVVFENINAKSEGGALFASLCQDHTTPTALNHITLRNVSLEIFKKTNINRSYHDFRPLTKQPGCVIPQQVEAPIDGIFAGNVFGMTLDQVNVNFDSQKPRPSSWSGKCLDVVGASSHISKQDFVCANVTDPSMN